MRCNRWMIFVIVENKNNEAIKWKFKKRFQSKLRNLKTLILIIFDWKKIVTMKNRITFFEKKKEKNIDDKKNWLFTNSNL